MNTKQATRVHDNVKALTAHEEEALARHAERVNSSIKDQSLFSLFAVDEDNCLPSPMSETAQFGSVCSPTARRLQITMAEAYAAGARAGYFSTLVTWATMLLKRLPVQGPRAHRDALANTIELSLQIVRGSNTPATGSALQEIENLTWVDESFGLDPAACAAALLVRFAQDAGSDAADGWHGAAELLISLSNTVSEDELEPLMQECAAIAYRNLFRMPANDNAEKEQRGA